MQTLLPYADFSLTAKVLDNNRLSHQVINDCTKLYDCEGPLIKHPTFLMWQGYLYAFCMYAYTLACELHSRRVLIPQHGQRWVEYWEKERDNFEDISVPPWLGDERVHKSHRQNLLRKDWEHYGPIFLHDVEGDIYWVPRMLDNNESYKLECKRASN